MVDMTMMETMMGAEGVAAEGCLEEQARANQPLERPVVLLGLAVSAWVEFIGDLVAVGAGGVTVGWRPGGAGPCESAGGGVWRPGGAGPC